MTRLRVVADSRAEAEVQRTARLLADTAIRWVEATEEKDTANLLVGIIVCVADSSLPFRATLAEAAGLSEVPGESVWLRVADLLRIHRT